VGDEVMLSTKNLPDARPKKKLSYKFTGPFEIEDIVGKQAYRLRLPEKWRIHPVFHVSLLEPYYRNASTVAPEDMILVGEDEEWEVEDILDDKPRYGKPWYLVRWKGFPPCEDSWIPKAYLAHAQRKLKEYETKGPPNPQISKARKPRLRVRKEDPGEEQ